MLISSLVIPFPLFELQSKWVAGILSGWITLPSQEEMMDDIMAFYSSLEAAGIPKRYTHLMGDSLFEYSNWLATQCGCEEYEEWRKQMFYATAQNRIPRLETHRDEWDDHDLVLEAHEDFVNIDYETNIFGLFLELASGGSLLDLMKDHGGKIPEEHVKFYIQMILKGLVEIHSSERL
ncbi:hypothetical protein CCACVL1_01513 [Corchorus capsularis]|uniref:Protein kinase domain-containing protein n=1 Tax=Corchorus capsularis TaxID=210143 RepID=A0A1R3KHK6_COCAP|nr:hypothetical protein CCACVL1_01513 [Corchorus capsularis]